MDLIGFVRGFLLDLVKLPLFFKLVVVWMAGATAWQWCKKRKHAEMLEQSAHWPVYRARVVWAQVSGRTGGGEDGPSFWEGVLTYSYTVPGQELEVGEYRKRFFEEDQADEWARSLRDQFVDVRVDPTDHRRSVWQETPYLPTPAARLATAFDSQPSGLGAVSTLLVFSAAAAGALIASWIQLSCVLGKPAIALPKDDGLFFGLHIGAVACAILTSLVTKQRSQGWTRSWRDSAKTGTTGATLVKVLGTYYLMVFFYGWVRMGAHPGAGNNWAVLMFSAGWLLFYLTSARTCWHAIQSSDERISQEQ